MKENFLIMAIIVILVGSVFGFILYNSNKTDESTPSISDSGQTSNKICEEPQNPYDLDSGHYAGFEWEVENNGNCDTGNTSFDEGCEEYVRQLSEYNNCASSR